MDKHSHVMGGSTAERRINCPGSLHLEKAVPDKESSEFAERGSMLHAAMELLLTADPEEGEVMSTVNQLIGQDLGFDGHEITEELAHEKILPAWDAWVRLRDEYELEDWFIEQRVSLEVVVPGAFGTADILAKDAASRLHIIDWKFGDGIVVPAEQNIGLGFYAASALYDEDPELIEFTNDIGAVVYLHIIQPRVGQDTVLSSWMTTDTWIENLVDLAAAAVDKAHSDNPPLKPGKWCGFCKARPTCPAQTALATEAISKSPEAMNSVDLAQAMRIADTLQGWIKDVYRLAQDELEQGASIPGYKLVNKMPRRVWTDPAEAEKRLRAAKLKVGDIYKKTLISPTQAEKLDARLYNRRLHDIVAMHSSGVTIAPDSDKRQAVVSSAQLLANALPEQKQETVNRNRKQEKP